MTPRRKAGALGRPIACADGDFSPETGASFAALTFVLAALVLVAGGGGWLGPLDLTFLGLPLGLGCRTLL